jgi:predicted Zn-dependent protease
MLRKGLSLFALATISVACSEGVLRQAGNVGALFGDTRHCDAIGQGTVAVEEENAVGSVVAINWISRGGGLVIDAPRGGAAPPSQSRANQAARTLNLIGKNLGAQSDRPNLDWTFGVLESPVVNAFSAPGGYVLVTRGLLHDVENEAQLAGVLAHEIAHVSRRHALDVYKTVKANQCRMDVAAALAGDVAAASLDKSIRENSGGYLDLNDVSNILALEEMSDAVVDWVTSKGYASEDEFEADQDAMALLVSAGYDPNEYVEFVGRLKPGGTFANHPEPKARQAKLRGWLDAQKPDPSRFGNPDHPFTSYAKAPLAPVLKSL